MSSVQCSKCFRLKMNDLKDDKSGLILEGNTKMELQHGSI